jgi:tricorn protease
VPESGGGMSIAGGTKLVYTPIDRDFRSWKRYRGGRAQDVWTYDLAAQHVAQLTTDRRSPTDQPACGSATRVYFASDRSDTANLYSMRRHGGRVATKPDRFTDFDVLWPSAGPDAIVFEQGGSMWRMTPGTPARQHSDLHRRRPAADLAAARGGQQIRGVVRSLAGR